ncbi:lysophospholipid acyltransferase family protein [soil metagenome]
MEPVFRAMEIAAEVVVKATATAITFRGLDNIPRVGGAVIAINHTSYVDFVPAALAAKQRNRRMRFMIKSEMQKIKPVNYLIRHSKAIPVDRSAGADSYSMAVSELRDGEIVGVYPEATISRSFELKEFKSGAARMALEAQVPIIPVIVWGAQRIWTKDHPKSLGRNKIPISVAVGVPIAPSGTAEQLADAMRTEMSQVLDRVQTDYAHPDGVYWVPKRLGGTAPTPVEAKVLDEAELARRRMENR